MSEKPVLIHPNAGERGMTELHYAAYSNDVDAVRKQLQLRIPVDARDDNGQTPLLWSIDMAQATGDPIGVVSLLLEAVASANATDHSGLSVLMMACGRNNLDILSKLIAAGANVHWSDAKSTPLHEAAKNNFSEGIRCLVLNGADIMRKDSLGRTAEQIAEQNGFEDSVSVLREFRSKT